MARNVSEVQLTLEDLNNQEAAERTPAIVYLSIIMTLGIPGNLLIIAVYFGTLKKRKGTHWLFIRALALTDLLVCCIAVPFELFQQTHQLTFYSEEGCKIFRAISVHLSLTSALLLTVMSANRFRKVCQPFKVQMTVKHGLLFIGLVVGVSFLFCLPEGVISGINLKNLANNVTGHDCSFDDRFDDTEYTTIYSTVLMAIYLACMLSLVIIYSIVGKELFQRAKFNTVNIHSCQHGTDLMSKSCLNHDTTSHTTESINGVIQTTEQTLDTLCKIPNETCAKFKSNARKNTSRKITRISFAISFCFILSYLPFAAVKLNGAIARGRYVVTPLTNAIFPVLGRSFVINNIVNPIIYGCLDRTFVRHCKLTMKNILYMNKQK